MSITQRIDAITGLAPEYRRTVLPAPKACKIELTSRCNFNCSFCAQSMKLREHADMDWDLYCQILPELRDAGVEELGLFYLGESFLYPKLEKAIDYAKNTVKFPYTFLTTNGSLAKPSRVKKCMEAGLDSLKFSLNYADIDQFQDIARVKPALFKNMLDNIRAAKGIRDEVLKEKGHYTGLYASYIEYDGIQGIRMRKMVDEVRNSVDEIYALPLYNQADFVGEQEREKGWKPTPGNRGRVEALRDPLPCWAIFQEAHITFDGRLSACCFDHDNSFDMGDLKEMKFMAAWNSDKFKELRAAHLKKDVSGTVCEKCMAYQ